MHSHESNLAVVIHGARDVRVEERAVPIPASGEVRVDVSRGGICGSDLSYYSKGAVGDFAVRHPMVLGHEIVGRIGEAGADVSQFSDRQRVVVDPSSPCLRCDRCTEGRSNACLAPTFLGSASTDPHVDGGFASAMTTHAQNAVPVSDALSDADVVFAEPLSVTVHAINRAGGVKDKRVLVVGAGPIGSILSAAALHEGVGHITVTDLAAGRLATVVAMGVHDTVLVGSEEIEGDFDVVFECSGSAPGIHTALIATRKAGALVLVGLPHGGPVAVPIGLTVSREMDVFGSFRFNHDEFVAGVAMLERGLDLSPLVSNSFAASDAPDAFIDATQAHAMKVQLVFS